LAQLNVRHNAIWAKHIDNGPHIVEAICRLEANAPLTLRLDKRAVVFRKMRDGTDGRPTLGLRADDSSKDFWNTIYATRRGDVIEIELDTERNQSVHGHPDAYLANLPPLLSEWDSEEDNLAYNDL
jgi:hypothetical protein